MVGVGEKVCGEPDVEERHAAVVLAELAHQGRQGLAILAAAHGSFTEGRAQAPGGLLPGEGVPSPMTDLADLQPQGARSFPQTFVRLPVQRGRACIQVKTRVLGVRRPAVIALHVVLDRELPVRSHRVGLPECHLRVRPAVDARGTGQHGLDVVKAEGLGREADEDEALDDAAVQAPQSEVLALKTRGHARRGAQAPIQGIAPRMVRAHEGPRACAAGLFRTHTRATVPADVHQGADLQVATAHDDDGLAADLGREVFPRFTHLAVMPDAVPVPQQRTPEKSCPVSCTTVSVS